MNSTQLSLFPSSKGFCCRASFLSLECMRQSILRSQCSGPLRFRGHNFFSMATDWEADSWAPGGALLGNAGIGAI
jgi:hypothetical protein